MVKEIFSVALSVAIVGFLFAAWLTHVIVCIQTYAWGFMIAGALFFPVGIVHGVGIWFGLF